MAELFSSPESPTNGGPNPPQPDSANPTSPEGDTVIDKYEAIVLWGIVLPSLIMAFVAFPFYQGIVDDSCFPSILLGSLIPGISFAGAAGILSFLKYQRFPWVRKYLVAFILSLIFSPALSGTAVLGLNGYLDTATPIVRTTVVIRKSPPNLAKRLYVKSWRADMPEIGVEVNQEEYNEFYEGESVSVRTKPGFLGIERILRK